MDCTDHEEFSSIARDHAANPRNYGPIRKFDNRRRITGPCGDTMEFWLLAKGDKVDQMTFITDGCGSSLACGSMATTLAQGKRIEEAANIQQKDIIEALGSFPHEHHHCALLAATTMKAVCEDYLKSHADKSSCGTCEDKSCSASHRNSGETDEDFESRQKLQSRLCRIRHKIVVLSGKGGVGKSTVAVNLAIALTMSGKRVGLLDVDIHGPSIPTMLNLEHEQVNGCEDGMLPVEIGDLKVMSLGFLLRNQDDAVIWRGPMKMGVIKQFLTDVVWGDLDFMIIDSPPGTGDEPLSVCQLIEGLDGAVIVTTPQKVAAVDVRKSITFCRQLNVPVLGVVENMSGFVCPKCGEITQILPSGGGKQIAESMGVPFLGSIPMDPMIAEACDNGRAYIQSCSETPTSAIMRSIVAPIAALDDASDIVDEIEQLLHKKDGLMRIAIPLADGRLTAHFGHCKCFAVIDVDTASKGIAKREDIDAPPHQPGLLPPWLAERGVTVIIAGGMGQRAQDLFVEQGIHVIVGAASETPERLVDAYLAGTLQVGENACDH